MTRKQLLKFLASDEFAAGAEAGDKVFIREGDNFVRVSVVDLFATRVNAHFDRLEAPPAPAEAPPAEAAPVVPPAVPPPAESEPA